jgi:signal transduction histidine kinase
LQRERAVEPHQGDGLALPSAKSRDQSLKILAAQESERRRIARDLHDEFGQVLTGLKFDLAWLRNQLVLLPTTGKTGSLLKKTKSMMVSVDALMASVRKTARSLHPSILDDLGLLHALEWLVNDFRTRNKIACKVHIDPSLCDFKMTIESSTALYRIVQELLTNVARHAQASAVSISLSERAGQLILELVDDGRGIEQDRITQSDSLGLRGVQERVSMLDGTIRIVGKPGLGTVILITLPHATNYQSVP